LSDYHIEVRITLVKMRSVMPIKQFVGCIRNEVELAGDEITDEEIISAIRTLKNHPANCLKSHWRFP